jgi:hypothetical protein
MGTASIVAALDAEITKLTQARALLAKGANLESIVGTKARVAKTSKRSGKRSLSPESRARMAEAQRKRWATAKKSGK